MIGLVVGLIRFIWEYSYTVPPCGQEDEDNRPSIIKDVHYLHFGCILFAIVFISTIIISLLTKPIDDKHVSKFKDNLKRNEICRWAYRLERLPLRIKGLLNEQHWQLGFLRKWLIIFLYIILHNYTLNFTLSIMLTEQVHIQLCSG